MGYWIGRVFPSVHLWMLNSIFSSAMEKAWGEIESDFRLQKKPEYVNNISAILFNDDLVPALREGRIQSTHGVRRVCNSRCLELDDGTILEDIDCIIACTGYYTPFEMFGDSLKFTQPNPEVPPQPDLYQNIFSLDHPDSLACLNYIVAPENAAGCRELASMAIANVWAGKSTLPSQDKMRHQIRKHQAWYAKRCSEQPVPQLEGLIEADTWLRFVHKTAGTGLYERLGWSWSGFLFSLKHPSMYRTMAYGVNTPHLWRYFETGKRKAWPGAKEAILHANEMSKEDLAAGAKHKIH